MWMCKFLVLPLLLVAHASVNSHSISHDESDLSDEFRYGSLGEPLTPEDFENAEHMQDSSEPYPDEVMENQDLFEGDIVLPSRLRRMMQRSEVDPDDFRNAIVNEYQKWPGGVIPYVISAAFNTQERSVIARAILEYHRRTCIQFRPRSSEADYIHIQKGNGCSSHVGRSRGGQPVTLGQGCVHTGTVIHELMHAAGFWHEQSRFDRDDYVVINYNNIMPGMEFNFRKYRWGEIRNLSVTYDIYSVMHYPKYAFAKDRRYPTITAKNPNHQLHALGQRDGFSDKDVQKLNILYRCAGGFNVDGMTTTEEGSTVISPTDIPIDPNELPDTLECEDKDEYCVPWSETGECDKNPEYMLANCAKSCKVCQTVAEGGDNNAL